MRLYTFHVFGFWNDVCVYVLFCFRNYAFFSSNGGFGFQAGVKESYGASVGEIYFLVRSVFQKLPDWAFQLSVFSMPEFGWNLHPAGFFSEPHMLRSDPPRQAIKQEAGDMAYAVQLCAAHI